MSYIGYRSQRRNLFLACASEVAQICNLLYRRIAFCGPVEYSRVPAGVRRPADCKSAIQQIANLRYLGCAFLLYVLSLLCSDPLFAAESGEEEKLIQVLQSNATPKEK